MASFLIFLALRDQSIVLQVLAVIAPPSVPKEGHCEKPDDDQGLSEGE